MLRNHPVRPTRARSLLWLVVAVFSSLRCSSDSSTGPTPVIPSAPATIALKARLAPLIPGSAVALSLDSWRVRAAVGADSAVLDTVLTGSVATAESLSVSLNVSGRGANASLTVQVQARSGSLVRYSGSVGAVTTSGNTVPVSIGIPYVGAGRQLASWRLTPRDTALTFGDVLRFKLTAIVDSTGATIAEPPLVWLGSTPATKPDVTGALAASPVRASGWAIVTSLTGIRDSAFVSFVPRAVAMRSVSGDGQSAQAGDSVPQLIAARVIGADSLGIARVPVRFSAVTAGAQVRDTLVVTDSTGTARTRVRLAPVAGPQRFTAQSGTAGLVTYTMAATSLPVAKLQRLSGDAQSQVAGTTLGLRPTVVARDSLGNVVPGATVVFTASAGNGRVIGDTVRTDSLGQAAVGAWILDRVTGIDTLVARSGAVAPVSFSAVGIPGPPAKVVVVSGDAQLSAEGAPAAQPLVAEVQDSVGNAVSQVRVTWTTTSGSVAPASVVTSTNGRAQATWTLGAAAARVRAIASVSGATPAEWRASATSASPSVSLRFLNGTTFKTGGTDTLRVRIPTLAPAGGIVVHVQSSAPGSLGVANGGVTTIAEGDTVAPLVLSLVSPGLATLTATASGFRPDSATAIVSSSSLTSTAVDSVIVGGLTAISVTLSAPAPTGGLVVSASLDDTLLAVVPGAAISVGAGATVATIPVRGVRPGSTTLRLSAPGFGATTTTIRTIGALQWADRSRSISRLVPTNLSLQLGTALIPQRAPFGGLVVSLVSRDPSCISTPTVAEVLEAQSRTTVQATVAFSGTTGCTTYIVASAAGYRSDSVQVSPDGRAMRIEPGAPIAANLMRETVIRLPTRSHGGTTVTIRSVGEPSVLLFEQSSGLPRPDSLTVAVPPGLDSLGFYLIGSDRLGQAKIIASSPIFTSATDSMPIVVPVVRPLMSSRDPAALDPAFNLGIWTGVTVGQDLFIQPLRADRPTPTVTMTTDAPSIAGLLALGTTAPVVTTLAAAPRGWPATGSLIGLVAPRAVGVARITASAPGFESTTAVVTVGGRALRPVRGFGGVGAGLVATITGVIKLPLSARTTIVVRSQDPTLLQVASVPTNPPADSAVIVADSGATTFTWAAFGVSGRRGATLVQASAPGFDVGIDSMSVYPPVVAVAVTGSPVLGRLGPTVRPTVGGRGETSFVSQGVRSDALPFTVKMTMEPLGIARFVTPSAPEGVDTVDVMVAPGSGLATGTTLPSYQLRPIAAGRIRLVATSSGFSPAERFFPFDIEYETRGARFTAGPIGAGLRTTGQVILVDSLTERVVTLRSLNPGALKFAATDSAIAMDSVRLLVRGGGPLQVLYSQFQYEATAGASGMVPVRVSADGYPDELAMVTVLPPAIHVRGTNAVASNSIDPVDIVAEIGVNSNGDFIPQSVGRNGAPIPVRITSDNAGALLLVTSRDSVGAPHQMTTIPVGQARSPTVAMGGVGTKTVGEAVVPLRASAVGFASVQLPGDTIRAKRLGVIFNSIAGGGVASGHMTLLTYTFAGGRYPLVVRSLRPGLVRISTSDSLTGTDSLSLPQSQALWIHALEGAMVKDSTWVTFSSPGSRLDSLKVVVWPANLKVNVTVADSAAVEVQTGFIPFPGGFSQQRRRAGGQPVAVTLTSSDRNVVRLYTANSALTTVATTMFQPRMNALPLTLSGGAIWSKVFYLGPANVSAVVQADAPGYADGEASRQVVVPRAGLPGPPL